MEKLKQYKYQIIIAILAILFVIWYNYTNNSYQRLQGEHSVLQAQYNAQKENVKLLDGFRKREKDSLSKAIVYREEENEKLRLRNRTIQDKIDGIKKRVVKLPKDLKTSVAYYNIEYKTDENKIVEDKVGLGLDTSSKVVEDIENGKKFEEIIVLKDKQILNKDINIDNLEKDKKDLSVLIVSAESQIYAEKKLNELGEKENINLNKQNKKLKTAGVLTKILVPIAFVLGIIIAR
jgi:hypothetical protein